MWNPTVLLVIVVGNVFLSNVLGKRLRVRDSVAQVPRVKVGLEVAMEDKWKALGAKGARVGIFTDHTGCHPTTGKHAVDLMHASKLVNLTAIFAPDQRGFRGAGSSDGKSNYDPKTGVRVFDAFRRHGADLASIIRDADVDVIVVDMQDVGTRCYRCIWQLYDLLVACAILKRADESDPPAIQTKQKQTQKNIKVVVLDRPNPLGGTVTEGPVFVDDGKKSHMARCSIPLRHGLTIGELAVLFNDEFVKRDPLNKSGRAAASLKVVKMKRWRRTMGWADTCLPWTPPWADMPTSNTALAFVGTCLLQATNVSPGKGTTSPFELVGARWADERFAEAMNTKVLRGGIPEVGRTYVSTGGPQSSTRSLGAQRRTPDILPRTSEILQRTPDTHPQTSGTPQRRTGGRSPFLASQSHDWSKTSVARSRNQKTRKSAPAAGPPVVWREVQFVPEWGVDQNERCVGAHAFVKHHQRALCLEGVLALLTMKILYPRDFTWREGFVSVGAAARPSREASRINRAHNRASTLVSPVKPGGGFLAARKQESSRNGSSRNQTSLRNGSNRNPFNPNPFRNPQNQLDDTVAAASSSSSVPLIDLLTGTSALRVALDSGGGGDAGTATAQKVEGVFQEWEKQLAGFEKIRKRALLYP